MSALAASALIALPLGQWAAAADTPTLAQQVALKVSRMTLEEKVAIVTGHVGTDYLGKPRPKGSLGSAGFVQGVPRLGIPAIQLTDAGLGVTNPAISLAQRSRPGDTTTALPSMASMAASWDTGRIFQAGALIGSEARARGFNVLLAGGINLVREPLGGRNFEYAGEDPLLAGVMVGEMLRGIQSRHIVSTIKHFALNAQETGRFTSNAIISPSALMESDLLAFRIGIERGKPGAVMCSYNKVNGDYACENKELLSQILKTDWKYPGFVLSDWGAVHSTAKAANAGVDQESAQEFDDEPYFGASLLKAVAAGEVSEERLSDMVTRILTSMGQAAGPDGGSGGGGTGPGSQMEHDELARELAASGSVLLKNERSLLPLASNVRRVLVIGGHADRGVLSGSGSSQVTPPGGYGLIQRPPGLPEGAAPWVSVFYTAPSPLAQMRSAMPDKDIAFVDGSDIAATTAAARKADAVIIFAVQPSGEGADLKSLDLPDNQDALISVVAEQNARTIVVLQSSGPVLMPWLDRVSAVLEVWYPGSSGANAIADLLSGKLSPEGRLPVTFPRSLSQGPRPGISPQPAEGPYEIRYNEGSDVGYRWYSKQRRQPLFPFGYGLSYTRFNWTNVRIPRNDNLSVELDVRNAGPRDGYEVVQLYASPANGAWSPRLAGWNKVFLRAGESRRVKVSVQPLLLSRYDVTERKMVFESGHYKISVSRSASDAAVTRTVYYDPKKGIAAALRE